MKDLKKTFSWYPNSPEAHIRRLMLFDTFLH